MPTKLTRTNLADFLNAKAEEYNQPGFIKDDPISVPHLFTKKQDIEISGFFAAVFAWGNRTAIINKSKELMRLMCNAPYPFITGHSEKDLKKLAGFKHRTFNADDLLYFIEFLHLHYAKNKSLENAFTGGMNKKDETVETGLNAFRKYFLIHGHEKRTEKHIAAPEMNSTCKRLNMFLRWMVRKDNKGVDFGIWKNITPSQLICPIDLHVARVARRLGILKRKQTDWLAALELTEYLRTLDKDDPVKYDFALFGLGAIEKF
ncbi:MAG: TIGR02757 family protein [Bacteroidota bacterium]